MSCAHPHRTDGVCDACGDCRHELVLNGACYYCGSRDLDPRELAARVRGEETLVPVDRLSRGKSKKPS